MGHLHRLSIDTTSIFKAFTELLWQADLKSWLRSPQYDAFESKALTAQNSLPNQDVRCELLLGSVLLMQINWRSKTRNRKSIEPFRGQIYFAISESSEEIKKVSLFGSSIFCIFYAFLNRWLLRMMKTFSAIASSEQASSARSCLSPMFNS